MAHSPTSAPHPNFIPSPGFGSFPVNPFGQVAPAHGAAAGFQQVVTIQAACDIWKRTNASRDADGANGSPRWSNWLCSVSCPSTMVLALGVKFQLDLVFSSQQPGVQMPPVRPQSNDRGSGTGTGRGPSDSSDDIARNRRYQP